MIKKLLLFVFFIAFSNISFAQNNPVQNTTYWQAYVSPNNYFQLFWDEPAQPHDELLGYNVYRNDTLYRFQTETGLYNFYSDVYGYVANCGIDFLMFDQLNPGEGCYTHVTAVYAGGNESGYLETFYVAPLALQNAHFSKEKVNVYPNPTSGILNISNQNLDKIVLFDTSGKMLKEFAPASQIDVSPFSKGIYIIKLFSEQDVLTDKIIIQ